MLRGREPAESLDPLADLAAAGVQAGSLVAVALARDGTVGLAADRCAVWSGADPAAVVGRLVAGLAPRLTWWSAESVEQLLGAGLRPTACWDVTASHRLLHGGFERDPAVIWAVARGLDPEDRPRLGQLDLLAAGAADQPGRPGDPIRPDGHLHPGWVTGGPPDGPAAAGWACAALDVARRHQDELSRLPDRRSDPSAPPLPLLTAWSESSAEVLAVELAAGGLPLDRETAGRLIAERAGPRPADAAEAAAARANRDAAVLSHARGAADVDLRNPAQVRDLLARVGIDVPDTRSWRLEPLRGSHPLVDALLGWRKAERIATTYGWAWLDRHVGPDGRLRGSWTGCDGAAGRMTASAGLHNLPGELRAAVAAEPGHVLVRADLGQVEPRVLAAVSGDAALTRATADPDLYLPVSARLGCDRPTAKVAVLAAMYGQTSGYAGQALRGLDAAYPAALAYLRTADERGRAGEHVRTYGGRLVRMWPLPPSAEPGAVAARGRFARNAVVQGAAAELFKMWAVSVRAALPPGATIVLCLHDELLVQAPDTVAGQVVQVLHESLAATARRWTGGTSVRFVADVAVLRRWSDAKP